MNRKPVFDSVRRLLGRGFKQSEVTALDKALDEAIADPISFDPPKVRTVSKAGIDLIKRFEGCRLDAYKDAVGVPTIGYGATQINGKPVPMGLRITQDMADKLLAEDIERHADPVRKMVGKCTQGQFDALVSFAFNLGPENLRKSTLLKEHLAGDYVAAAAEFSRWNRAGGHVLRGLTRRREAERDLYNS